MASTKKSAPKKDEHDEKIHLSVSERVIFGKKVRSLRNQQLIPGNIYGSGFTSKAVQIPTLEFKRVLRKAGETHVVYLKIDKDTEELPTLIHNVHAHPVTGKFLHVDLRKVDLKKKIHTSVPLSVEGESPIVSQNLGVLQTLVDTVSIEALPDKIPSAITADVSGLQEVGAEITIADLPTSSDYVFVDPADKSLVRIIEHKEQEMTPQIDETPVETEVAEDGAPQEGVNDSKEESTDSPQDPPKESSE